MKILIGFVILSVAFATPFVQPVTLPKAALPAMERHETIPTFQRPDISPAMVPQEVIEALKLLGKAPFDTPVDEVQVIEVADDSPVDAAIPAEDGDVETVVIIEHIEEDTPQEEVSEVVAEDIVDPVHSVENAENIVDQVQVVEISEDIVAPVQLVEDAVVPVQIVQIADGIARDFGQVRVVEEIGSAIVLNHISFEDDTLDAVADSVRIVDVGNNMEIPVDADTVIVVEHAEEYVEEAENPADSVIVVDDIILPYETPADNEIQADPIRIVEIAIPTSLEFLISKLLRPNTVPVRVEYPEKVYDNPLLRSI